MVTFPNCKINIGLHITAKRPDGYHNLETVFYPLALQDALEIVASDQTIMNISGTPLDTQDNICLKAYQLLKNEYPQLPAVNIHLHKVIPTGAGLGGGSADGAFMLTALNKKFGLGLSQQQLLDHALQLGSDCPFFINNSPAYATGRGEKLEPVPLDLSAYLFVLVHPGIHISTAWAFSKLSPAAKHISLKEAVQQPVSEWRGLITNDFEAVAIPAHPEIGQIIGRLYDAGAAYASMSGSGSAVYGMFPRDTAPSLDFPDHYFVRHI